MTLRIGSLCSGYAGLDMAIQSVIGGELAWVADNDPGASKILAHHYPRVPNLGDLSEVDWGSVEPVDVAAMGFPCQDVSCAGARAGLREGNRTGVWNYCATAISVLRPPLVIIENVRGLLSAYADSNMEPCPWCVGDAGDELVLRACGAVLGDLASLGYDAEWTVVSAADAGAPHRRERVFIVAWPAADTAGARWGRGEDARADSCDAGTWSWGVEPERGRADVTEDADGAAGGERRKSAPGQTPGGRARADAGRPDRTPPAHAQGDGRDERRPEPARLSRRPDAPVSGPTSPADPGREGLEVRAVEHDGPERPTAERGRGNAPANTGCVRLEGLRPDPGPHTGRSAPVAWGQGPARSDSAPADPQGERRTRWNGTQPQLVHDGPEPAHADPYRGTWGAYEPAIRRWEATLRRPAPSPTEPGRTGDRLSPAFVEFMMGLPDGWITDVPGLSRNDQLKALGNGVVPQQAALALRLLLPSLTAAAA